MEVSSERARRLRSVTVGIFMLGLLVALNSPAVAAHARAAFPMPDGMKGAVAYPYISTSESSVVTDPAVAAGRRLTAAPQAEPVDPATSGGGRPVSTSDTSSDPGLLGWTLVWHDEFSGTSLDPTKWNVQNDGAGGYRVCCLNYGEQYWTPDAVQVNSGVLRIATQARARGGRSYTSGAVTTEHMFAFTYGRADIRAQLPTGQGMWPAFWLLPAGENWTSRAPYEIDIMESLGRDPHTVYMTNHWGSEWAMCTFTGEDFSQGFHVFSVDWSPGAVTWSIDGTQRCQITTGVSDRPMYLILNSALGGGWPGPPDQTTPLPQYLAIDYVRVYQHITVPVRIR